MGLARRLVYAAVAWLATSLTLGAGAMCQVPDSVSVVGATVRVHVTDTTRAPLLDADVVLSRTGDSAVFRIERTNARGDVVFHGLPVDSQSYTVLVRSI